MQPLKILILADDRPGHYHLSEGVAAAMGRRRPVSIETKRIKERGLLKGRIGASLLAAGLSPAHVLRFGYGIEASAINRPDVLITAGGDTLNANVALARLLGVPNIFCGTLRRHSSEAFALVISSYARHAGLPRHLVALKPNGMDPDTLGRDRPVLTPGKPPQLAGLLVGGDSGLFRYTPEEWHRLQAFLVDSHRALGTRWIVSTSRRSPDQVADALASLARRDDGPITELIDFRTAGPGTLPGLLARVEAILCTEDSSTMLSEAVCARLPVVGVAPAEHAFKDEEREYRDFMLREGWCRFVPLAKLTPAAFSAALREVKPLHENHLDTLAGEIAQRLPQLFL